jgi:hypothetical protein
MADRVTWENDIKHFFTQMDVGCMRARNLDLSDYEMVKTRATSILSQLKLRASRPTENVGMPKGGRPWPQERIDKFEAWKNAGFPKNGTDPGPSTT